MAAQKVAFKTIENRIHGLGLSTLVDRWSPPKAPPPDAAACVDPSSIKQPDSEKSHLIDTLGWMPGKQLHELLDDNAHAKTGNEALDNLDLETHLAIRPVLLLIGEPPMITGDTETSMRQIRRMNLESSYPVIWVKQPVFFDAFEVHEKPPIASQVKESESRPPKIRLSKGDISRIEAEQLGISPAALRKRKSRERMKTQTNAKK